MLGPICRAAVKGASDRLLKRVTMVFRVDGSHVECLLLTYSCSESVLIANFEGIVYLYNN